MRRSWLTAASALAAIATDLPEASAQLFTAPSEVDFADTLVGSTSSEEFSVVVRETITSGEIFAAAAPFSGGPVSLGTTKAQVFATYNFAPTITGTATDSIGVSAANLGAKTEQSGTILLSGLGVAPVERVSTGSAPVARIGTSSLQTVTVSNTGDGNLSGLGDLSDLHGSLGASTGVFAGSGGSFDLADSSQTSFDYTFTPVAHGTATATVTANFLNGSPDGKNQAASQDVTLSGQGVGPEYSSSTAPGGVIDLGTINLGGTGAGDLEISNISTDPTSTSPTLTELSLLAADFQGEPPGFALENFVPDTVLSEGDLFDLKISFDATSLGMQTADLAITTDQNSAFGQMGQTFDYQIVADVVPVPEPRTWVMLLTGFGLAGLRLARGSGRRKPATPGPQQEK